MTEEKLIALRADVAKQLSPYRMKHTLGVEEMAARLAALYCPEKEMLLRAAALLHDVTKELTDAEQLRVFADHGVTLRPDEQASPNVWHGMTAALIIPIRYPEFADAELLSAVRWHTTGRGGMTLCEALLYLADIIEEGRDFADCITLRYAFFDPVPEKMDTKARLRHLRDVLRLSYENLIPKLQARGGAICLDSLAAYEDLTKGNKMEDVTFENWETLASLADASPEELAEAIRFVLDAKRGRDIAVIPVVGRSDITDCLVLASATSSTHVRALAGEVEYRLGQRGVQPLHTDGGDKRDWMVVDYGTVMVHVFDREAREFYHLDKLYADPTGTDNKEG